MKTNRLFSLVVILCLVMQVSFAQESKNQMFVVHEDQVLPSKIEEYEKAALALSESMKEHNIQSTNWLAANTANQKYMFITPIENMADLDKNGFADLVEKMGKDEFANMMSGFDGCYDKHGDYVIYLIDELSYMPDGMTQTPEGENFRKFYYIYTSPEATGDMYEAMKEIKEVFAAKGSKLHYRVYKSGFGLMDNFFMVATSGKNSVDLVEKASENGKVIGEEGKKAFDKMLKLCTRYEEILGWVRPDLSYMPKEKEKK